MTGLRKSRKVAEGLVIGSVAWEVAATIVSLVILLLVAVQGGALSPNRLIEVVGTVGLYGVVMWAIPDARRRRRRLERESGVAS